MKPVHGNDSSLNFALGKLLTELCAASALARARDADNPNAQRTKPLSSSRRPLLEQSFDLVRRATLPPLHVHSFSSDDEINY